MAGPEVPVTSGIQVDGSSPDPVDGASRKRKKISRRARRSMALVLRYNASMAHLVASWQGIAAGAAILTSAVLCVVIWWFGRRGHRVDRHPPHDHGRAA
jgi:hypothetical protein